MRSFITLNGKDYPVMPDPDFGSRMGVGVLHGEDAETGERWSMKFWVPEAAVTLYGTEDAA